MTLVDYACPTTTLYHLGADQTCFEHESGLSLNKGLLHLA